MAYKYKLKEEEAGAEVTPSNREQVNYDVVVTPKGVSIEDTVKALETLDNYGMYVSNMRNKASIQKALEDHFGPVIPAKRKKMEKDQGFPFPVKTKQAIDDFVKSLTSKPTLLKYKVKDNTIVFPKSGNPVKDLTKKIIDVVMKNAKIDYSITDKEAVDEVIKEGTPEQEKIKKIVNNYINLRKAIDDPNYPDTVYTTATMKKVENILKQMSKKESYRLSLLKILPSQYQDFLKEAVDEVINEETRNINNIKKKLDALGVKYEMSTTNKVKPFKVIYKPINKSDEFYDKFEDIVDLFNLKDVVKISMSETKEESYMISKGGSKQEPHYVLEKPDGSKQLNMTFSSPENAKEYAKKHNIHITSKGYNMDETKLKEIIREKLQKLTK